MNLIAMYHLSDLEVNSERFYLPYLKHLKT